MQEVLIQLVSGVIAGCSLVTLGMPLDLLKTKLQVNRSLSMEYFRKEVSIHGSIRRTFYRGASSLYLFIGSACALEFMIFETSFELLSSSTLSKEAQLMASGFMAGICSSFIYTPIEYTKIQLQLEADRAKVGSAKRIYHILAASKLRGLKEIYTGLHFTMMKQAPGIALYFGGFHVVMMDIFKEKDRQNASLTSQVFSAFAAGIIYNMWGYPFDTIKTNVQSGNKDVIGLIKSRFWSHQNYRQGLLVAFLRGLIVDSSNMIVYERVKNFLHSLIKKDSH